jgi:CRP-like cAMP-binding protein
MVIENNLAELKKFFYKYGLRMDIPRKNVLIFQGDIVKDVYFVNQGIYKIYNIDSYGEERTISLGGQFNLLPLSWQMIEPPKNGAFYFYEAVTDMIIYRVSQEKFKDMLQDNINLAYYLLDVSTRANVMLEGRIQNLQKSKVEEKTEFILYFLAKRLGRSRDGKVFRISKAITQKDIADLAGINRETAARFLLKARSTKMAWKTHSNYYIDITKLDSIYKVPVYS